EVVKQLIGTLAQRGDATQTGDDDATLHMNLRFAICELRLQVPADAGNLLNRKLQIGNRKSLVAVFLDVVDGLTHCLDLFSLFVGDGQLEFILEFHHQFDGIQRVGVEVVDEM